MRPAKFCVPVLVGFFATVSAFPQPLKFPPELAKVRLLSDDYDRVINRLGTPADGTTEPEIMEEFQFEIGKVQVMFTRERCVSAGGDPKPFGWDVPIYSVEKIWLYLKEPFPYKDSNIDFGGFEFSEAPNWTFVHNDRIGRGYRVIVGEIDMVSYYPTDEQEKRLRCQVPK